MQGGGPLSPLRSRVRSALLKRASSMRSRPTDSERLLLGRLGSGTLGLKFRFKHVLGDRIADFYCPALRLVVGLSGDASVWPEFRFLRLEAPQTISAASACADAVSWEMEKAVAAMAHRYAFRGGPPPPRPIWVDKAA